jgi:hypothetical protein
MEVNNQMDLKMTFNYHTDAGHGWLEVSLSECLANGLTPEDFSRFSYRSGDALFLEEDCDACVFDKAYQKTQGLKLETTLRHSKTTFSNIRDMEPIRE